MRLRAEQACWPTLLGPESALLVPTGVGPFGGQQPGVPLGYPIKAPKLPGESEGRFKRCHSLGLTHMHTYVSTRAHVGTGTETHSPDGKRSVLMETPFDGKTPPMSAPTPAISSDNEMVPVGRLIIRNILGF